MHVLVTGAAGFVGRALAARLQREGRLGDRPITRLTLLDLGFGEAPAQEGFVRRCAGDLADPAVLDDMLGGSAPDALFHLASIPGGTAEANPTLARRVNLDATLDLLERCRRRVEEGGSAPRFVFASSIAVFGALPAAVGDETPTRPLMSYGAHKLVGEVLVDDFGRRGWVEGISLRLPGVLARPPARTGQLSAFLSDMIREPPAGRTVVCPMAPQATTWALSLPAVVQALLHAGSVVPAALQGRRTFTLPALRFSMAELVDALAAVHGGAVRSRVDFQPQERLEALFGRFPPLATPAAGAAGFRADPDLAALVRRATQDDPPPPAVSG